MELPASVLIHNPQLGMKGNRGTLVQISEDGYYVVTCTFGDKLHRVFLPIEATVLIAQEAEEAFGGVEMEIER